MRRRGVALAYGALCHGLFALAVGAMVIQLHGGLQWGLVSLGGWAGWAWNAALVLQFPLVHSALLTRGGRRLLGRLAPREMGRDLSTTLFAISASVQLLLVFLLWSPSDTVLWRAEGGLRLALTALYGGCWAFLLKAMNDAGLAVQTGFLGWFAMLRGREPRYPALPTRGTFRFCRQPVYLAFTLILWTGPTWSADHLLLALTWTGYCLIGPLHKEERYSALYGAAFTEYRRRVPYFFPGSRR